MSDQPNVRTRDNHVSAAWPRDYLLKLERHVKTVTALQEADVLPPNWRTWTEIDFSTFAGGCPHTVCSIFEVENKNGVWGVEICNGCGEQVVKECPHDRLTWQVDGKALICDNCGHDGT